VDPFGNNGCSREDPFAEFNEDFLNEFEHDDFDDLSSFGFASFGGRPFGHPGFASSFGPQMGHAGFGSSFGHAAPSSFASSHNSNLSKSFSPFGGFGGGFDHFGNGFMSMPSAQPHSFASNVYSSPVSGASTYSSSTSFGPNGILFFLFVNRFWNWFRFRFWFRY
jgi:hypothetical protein